MVYRRVATRTQKRNCVHIEKSTSVCNSAQFDSSTYISFATAYRSDRMSQLFFSTLTGYMLSHFNRQFLKNYIN